MPKKCIVCGKELSKKKLFYCSEKCSFLNKISKDNETGCMNWNSVTTQRGHPMFKTTGPITYGAAKYAYEMLRGENIPEGVFLKNTCGNSLCINPDHFVLSEKGEGKRTKLSAADVKSIWEDGGTLKEIAKKHGISRGYVYSLKTKNTTWKRLLSEVNVIPYKKEKKGRERFTGRFNNPDKREEIIKMRKSGMKLVEIANIIGCDFSMVSRICNNSR